MPGGPAPRPRPAGWPSGTRRTRPWWCSARPGSRVAMVEGLLTRTYFRNSADAVTPHRAGRGAHLRAGRAPAGQAEELARPAGRSTARSTTCCPEPVGACLRWRRRRRSSVPMRYVAAAAAPPRTSWRSPLAHHAPAGEPGDQRPGQEQPGPPATSAGHSDVGTRAGTAAAGSARRPRSRRTRRSPPSTGWAARRGPRPAPPGRARAAPPPGCACTTSATWRARSGGRPRSIQSSASSLGLRLGVALQLPPLLGDLGRDLLVLRADARCTRPAPSRSRRPPGRPTPVSTIARGATPPPPTPAIRRDVG